MAEVKTGVVSALRKRVSIREEVTLALRAAIISGEMVPGEVYSAPLLSERFEVSATPVREAMLDLAHEGLVTAVVNKGFRVTEVSEQDLDDITNLRLLIEPPAVRIATPHVPERAFARFREMADEIVRTAETGALSRYLEVDRQFHLDILSYAGNAKLVAEIARLRTQTRMYGLQAAVENHSLAESAHEHHQIIDLIAARDGEAAEDLTIRHIAHARGVWATSDIASDASTTQRLWVQPRRLHS